jgi:hypothetical protein
VQQGEIQSGGSTSPTVYKDGWCGEHAEKDAPSMHELLVLTHQDLRELLARLSAPVIVTIGDGGELSRVLDEPVSATKRRLWPKGET